MLFNSWEFILVFLPIVFVIYFWLNKMRWPVAAQLALVVASLIFYGYWNAADIPLIVGSILFNFAIGSSLAPCRPFWPSGRARKLALGFGISINLAMLAYYKYAGFFVENVNLLLRTECTVPSIVLPLAISFFTFQQIAYLVDSYRGETAGYDLLRYALFVTFFPQLIAGPIVHHGEVMPQFASRRTWFVRYPNVLRGLLIFGIGLFKKVAIADTFAVWATAGFDGGQQLDFFAAWAASLSYTFQIYFDFSGYCDMAIGAALLFNIWLPVNFNSPYRALDIQDFWRRWHMTLSHFLREYLYIPLGGNRRPGVRTYANLLTTFVLGGLWHGASWLFVIWGAMHGAALVVHRLWRAQPRRMPNVIAWILTFMFVNLTWVFFRAKTFDDAMRVLRGMMDVKSALHLPIASVPTDSLAWGGWLADHAIDLLPTGLAANVLSFGAIIGALVAVSRRNSFQMIAGQFGTLKVAFGATLFTVGTYFTLASSSSIFLYFNF